MKFPLHILHLEDDPNDAALIQSTLEAEGIACAITRTETQDDFAAVLERGGVDIVLSDYSLPAFDGISATKIVRTRWPNLPVILVSGTLGEELAIESLKNGATDYVLKERLSRLGPAVRRAMQEVQTRAEHRRLNAQFIEAQKMEVVGQLASGVAHDFNNILGIIMGYCDLLSEELGTGNPLLGFTEEINQAAGRAVSLTQQLLVFSSKQTVHPVVLNLNEEVANLDKMLRRLIHENIEMTIFPGNQLGHIMADSCHIGQVLMNLVVNARDAMPKGGKLDIATTNITFDENYVRTHPGSIPGKYVLLSVRDTGTGMTPEVKTRLFEAFFTTKAKGKGTGLGLATCQTIVEQSGGHIDVQSEIGKGTTFKIYLPLVEQSAEVAARPVQTAQSADGTETLMVVEDDPSLRHLAREILKARGYQVLTAVNGQDALQVARNHQGPPIRLVITDVIMPMMGGEVMAQWLKTTYPDLKILFTSGYMDDLLIRQAAADSDIQFMPKPYTPGVLTRKVRDLLDQELQPQHDAEEGVPLASALAT
jgi:signal transduction histidine kinase